MITSLKYYSYIQRMGPALTILSTFPRYGMPLRLRAFAASSGFLMTQKANLELRRHDVTGFPGCRLSPTCSNCPPQIHDNTHEDRGRKGREANTYINIYGSSLICVGPVTGRDTTR